MPFITIILFDIGTVPTEPECYFFFFFFLRFIARRQMQIFGAGKYYLDATEFISGFYDGRVVEKFA